MRNFKPSKREQLSKNVFIFENGSEIILFNRMSLEYKKLKKNVLTDRLVNEIEEGSPIRQFRQTILKKIRIEMTLQCNCNCDYCLVYKNKLKQIGLSMNKNTANRIISFYKKNIKNGSLMIIGGEPLLNWPVVKIFINKIKDPIRIFTNGTIINDDIVNTLRNNRNVRLTISLDGKKTHNKHRKFKNNKPVYSAVIKNLKKFRENNCTLGIACLASKDNVGQLCKITHFFVNNLKINNLGISFPHHTLKEKTDFDMTLYTREMIKMFDFAIKNNVYIHQLAKRFSPLITKKFRFYSCKIIGEQQTFYPDGEKTHCTKIDSLKNSKKYNLNYFRNVLPINNKFCKNCPAIGICGGGCFWDGIAQFKNGIDERECYLNNSLIDYFLWQLCSVDQNRENIYKKFKTLII